MRFSPGDVELSSRRRDDSLVILEASGVSMDFGGLRAVSDLGFTVTEGQVLGILGPNGSGKTTVFNVLTGIYRPTGGTFTFKGQGITGLPPHRIAQLGIARTFQNIRLFADVSVLENILVGRHRLQRTTLWDALLRSRVMVKMELEAREKAKELLQFVDLEAKADEHARNLAYGEQRRLELARALASQPELLLLDEPTAGMGASEAVEIMELIRQIRQMGITVVLIEHNMRVMMSTAEWIVAMDAGHKIAEGTPWEIQHNEKVIQAYLGEEE